MTTIATRNNRIIARAGGVALDCGCCEDPPGACCEIDPAFPLLAPTCSQKPRSQCQGDGKRFLGAGSLCLTASCGCCSEFQGLPPNSTVSLTISRRLDVIANSGCGCGPGGAPPPVATTCRNDVTTFSQVGQASECFRSLSGVTPDVGVRFGSVGIAQGNAGCVLSWFVNWFINPCAGSPTPSFGYSWPFVVGQAQYAATFFLFTFRNNAGGSRGVFTVVDELPPAPVGFPIWLGSKWTVTYVFTIA